MNFDRLQNKQGIMRSFDCPSTHFSSLNPRDSALSTQVSALCIHQSRQHPELSPQHSPQSRSINPQQLFIEMSTDLLRQGQSVRFRAPGRSMHPTIKEGETITAVPVAPFDVKQEDILLYFVGRKVIAHRVVSIARKKGDTTTQASTLNPQPIFLLRGDASITYDDPVEAKQVLGKVVSVERGGRSIGLYSRRAKMLHIAHAWATCLKRKTIRIFPWATLPWHKFCTILRGLLLIKSSL